MTLPNLEQLYKTPAADLGDPSALKARRLERARLAAPAPRPNPDAPCPRKK